MGNLEQASQVLAEAVETSLQTDDLIVTLTSLSNLGRLQEDQGNLRSAADFYRRAIQIIDDKTSERRHPFPAARWAYIELAELYREWNQLDEAKRLLTTALEMKRQLNMLGGNLSIAYVILARILQAEGNIDGALAAIQQARDAMYGESPVALWIDAVQTRLWLVQGNLPAAAQWAQNSQLHSTETPVSGDKFEYHIRYPGEFFTLSRVYLAQGEFEKSLEILKNVEIGAQQTGRTGRLIEILMLKSRIEQARGNVEVALPLLVQSLTLSQHGGYMRIFADEGHPVLELLKAIKARKLFPNEAYLNSIIAAGADIPTQESSSSTNRQSPGITSTAAGILVEQLSNREIEVLQLVANGLSNREIAEKLFITVGTAKTHTINIYRKLDVNSRTQAVARAQELAII